MGAGRQRCWLYSFLQCFSFTLSLTTVDLRHSVSLSRRISQVNDPKEALELLQENTSDKAASCAVLELCYEHRDADTAEMVSRNSLSCDIAAMQVYGKCGDEQRRDALWEGTIEKTTGLFHAYLAAHEEARSDLLSDFAQLSNTVSYNIVLQRCSDAEQVNQLLERMPHQANIRTVHAVQCVLGSKYQDHLSPIASEKLSDFLTPETLPSRSDWSDTIPRQDGGGWDLGRLNLDDHAIHISLRPNRKRDGLKIAFSVGDTKVAFVLLTIAKGTTSLLGISIDPAYRSFGWTRHFLGVWLHLASYLERPCRTEMIRKPLLAKVLQQHLGFTCLSRGVSIVVLPATSDKIRVCATMGQSLEGVFSEGYCHRQNMEVISNSEGEGGSPVVVDTRMIGTGRQMPELQTSFDLDDRIVRNILLFEPYV